MNRRIGVLVNPASGRGRVTAAEAEVLHSLTRDGDHVVAIQGDSAVHADELTHRAVSDGLDLLVAMGGDGTVHMALQSVVGTDLPLGILPLGTGNDAATTVGIPTDIDAAVDTVLTGKPRAFDVGRVELGNGTVRYFLCVLTSGFDSTVNERANLLSWPSGDARYVIAMLAELGRFRPLSYRTVIDGEPIDGPAMLVSLGNGSQFGGGMRICPDADMHDGLLTLLWVHQLSRPKLLRLFPSIYSGSHVRYPEVEQRQVTSAHLEVPGQVIYADGERIGPLPADVTAVADAVRLIVP